MRRSLWLDKYVCTMCEGVWDSTLHRVFQVAGLCLAARKMDAPDEDYTHESKRTDWLAANVWSPLTRK